METGGNFPWQRGDMTPHAPQVHLELLGGEGHPSTGSFLASASQGARGWVVGGERLPWEVLVAGGRDRAWGTGDRLLGTGRPAQWSLTWSPPGLSAGPGVWLRSL